MEKSTTLEDFESSIYKHLGLVKFYWNCKIRRRLKQEVDEKHDLNDIITNFAKTKLYPIEENELIPRDQWDLKSLIGETEQQLLHKDYWMVNNYIENNHKRQHDILTIFECSNSKPYAKSRILEYYIKRFSGFSDFACISNLGIIPMEYSNIYPFRYDEWNHFAEKYDIANKYRWANIDRLLRYKEIMGYKHVLVLMQHPILQKSIDIMYDNNIKNCSEWLHIISNKNFRDTIKKEYLDEFHNQEGFLRSRLMNLLRTKYTYISNLKKYIPDDKQTQLADIEHIIMNEKCGGYSMNKAMREYRKKYNITPVLSHFEHSHPVHTFNIEEFGLYDIPTITNYIYNIKQGGTAFHDNRSYFTPLDVIWDLENHPIWIEDIDNKYWKMMNTLNHLCDKCGLGKINNYIFYKKSDSVDVETLTKDAIKQGIIGKKQDKYE